jgi:hypothetical protein
MYAIQKMTKGLALLKKYYKTTPSMNRIVHPSVAVID